MTARLRVLLADDDAAFGLLVESALNDLAHLQDRWQLATVNDGTAAVDYVLGVGEYGDRLRHPPPHVLLLDQRMRLMDGTEVLRKLRAHPAGRYLTMCLFSTSARRALTELAYDHGATFCIEKPLDYATLRRKLEIIVLFALEVLELQHLTPTG